MTLPQPKSAPTCEQLAARTLYLPLAVRKATSWRPSSRFETGDFEPLAGPNKYHEAGYSENAETGGGVNEASRAGATRVWLRVFMEPAMSLTKLDARQLRSKNK